MTSFNDEIEFTINNEKRKATCREESIQGQAGDVDIKLSDNKTESTIIQELAKKTENKEKIELPIKLSEESIYFFLKFFGFSNSTWLKKVEDRINCLLELLPVFEFLSLREIASSILKKIQDYLINSISLIKMSMKVDILKSLFTTYYSYMKNQTNLTLFDSNLTNAERLISKVLISIKPEEEFSIIMTELSPILLSKETKILEITCLFEQYVSDVQGIYSSSTRLLINIYYYSIVKHNHLISKDINKAFIEPMLSLRHRSSDNNKLEAEVKCMLENIEDMVARAKYNTQNIDSIQDKERKRYCGWSEEYKKAKDSFIMKLCRDELDPREYLNEHEDSIKENLAQLTRQVDSNKEHIGRTNNTIEENIKELTSKISQMQELMNNMNKNISSNVKEEVKELTVKLDTIPKLISNNTNSTICEMNKNVKCAIDSLKHLLLNKNVFKYNLVNSNTNNSSGIFSLCLMSDRELVSGSENGSINIFDLIENKQLAIISAHQDRIKSIIKWDDNTFVSGSYDGSIKIWDLKKRERIETIEEVKNCISSVNKLSDKLFLSGAFPILDPLDDPEYDYNFIKIWDFEKRQCLGVMAGDYFGVFSLCVMNEKTYVSSSNENYIYIWDIEKDSPIQKYIEYCHGSYCLCKVNEEQFISGTSQNTLKLWSLYQGLIAILGGHAGFVKDVFLLDTNIVASSSDDQTVKIWDLPSKACIETIQLESEVKSIIKLGNDSFASGEDKGKISVFSFKFLNA